MAKINSGSQVDVFIESVVPSLDEDECAKLIEAVEMRLEELNKPDPSACAGIVAGIRQGRGHE